MYLFTWLSYVFWKDTHLSILFLWENSVWTYFAIIISIIINLNWVVTRWQQTLY